MLLAAERFVLRDEHDACEPAAPDRTQARIGDRDLLARGVEARGVVAHDERCAAAVGPEANLRIGYRSANSDVISVPSFWLM